ncbi:MAG: type II toxin-antitoxin system VapC family toxin [Chlamydiales bacterium]|nr:type II toxin-antitoxin system VapC family toxin [Chlamydiales bacterium]
MPIVKSLQQHKVIFDTHVFLWYLFGKPVFSQKFLKSIDRIQKLHPVLISPMTIWEIGMLAERNRISLEMDCLEWVEQALSNPGFILTPLEPQAAILSSRLPGLIHGDPVDRLLIATAFETRSVLVTCDEKILEFGKNQFISVYDPRN